MNRAIAIATVIGSAALAGTASASTLTMTFNSLTPRVEGVNYNLGGNTGSTWAGVFNWTGSGTPYKTFCTQIGETIGFGQTATYNCVDVTLVPDSPNGGGIPVGPMGALRATVLKDLYARHYNDATLSSNVTAGAFQIAVWEITHESLGNATTAAQYLAGLNVTTGFAQFSDGSGASTLAQQWIAGLGIDGFQDFACLIGLTNESLQDQLLVVPVPIPAALAGLGLLGVGFLRRRVAK
ncbi:MAG: hypothetical protein U0572_16755 [Phycisphaerales bacterium]